MNRLKLIAQWGGISVAVITAVFIGAVFLLDGKTYDAPYPPITASTDSAVIARGKHFVYGAAHCNYCHGSKEDLKKTLNGEMVELRGGFEFVMPLGVIRTPNITPDKETGIGTMTDQELARALRYGVGHDGRALYGFMPFNNLSDEDLTAIISYLRSIPPVKNRVVNRELNFAGKAVTAFLIKPVGPAGEPAMEVTPDSTSTYGRYLANFVANCVGCHTDRDLMTGEFTGKPFAGGLAMDSEEDPTAVIISPNITPDPRTGRMAGWSEELFIHRFRQGSLVPGSHMPWGAFKNMSDLELKAIYRYLQTVEPVHNEIKNIVAKKEGA